MGYQIIGEIIKDENAMSVQITPYKSKIFRTQESAIKYAYSKVYRKDGNTKRTKNVLINFQIVEAH
jgi:hypothetical protein